MNVLGPVLDATIFALAILLVAIVASAALRYHDVRFGFVAAALVALGLVGALAAAALLNIGGIPGAELGTVPAALIIVTEALFYLSFVLARGPAATPAP